MGLTEVRKLSWAGVAIEASGRRLLIDPMQNTTAFRPLLGEPRWPPVPIPTPDRATDALVTHRHPDHFDPDALRHALGADGRVYCPTEIVGELSAAGFRAHGLDPWRTIALQADLHVTAVPAVDWRGDAQVSWVVEVGTCRIFHGGDTIWHGSWWHVASRFPGFDVAFLPANGVVARLPDMAPSNLPATLTPQQAAIATRLLRAKQLCPIHFGQFHEPETYREYPNVEASLRGSAAREAIALRMVPDGARVIGP